jgi:hypothetical protein
MDILFDISARFIDRPRNKIVLLRDRNSRQFIERTLPMHKFHSSVLLLSG